MQRCFLLSKLQYMETTKGLSVKVRMSLSANTCSTCKHINISGAPPASGQYLVPEYEVVLVDLLESESLFVVSVLHQIDSTVGSVGNQFDDLEILFSWNFGLHSLRVREVLAALTLDVAALGSRGMSWLLVQVTQLSVWAGAVQHGEVLLQLRERVPVEAELVDDVLRDLGPHPVHHPGLALSRLQQLIELLGVKLETLEESGGPRDDQEQLLDEAGEVLGRVRALVPRLQQQLSNSLVTA